MPRTVYGIGQAHVHHHPDTKARDLLLKRWRSESLEQAARGIKFALCEGKIDPLKLRKLTDIGQINYQCCDACSKF